MVGVAGGAWMGNPGLLWFAQRDPQACDACDRAAGTTVMSDLVGRYYRNKQAVDLDALWKELGVAEVGGRIVLDDAAPLAKWRKMIVMGPPGRPPNPVKLPWDL